MPSPLGFGLFDPFLAPAAAKRPEQLLTVGPPVSAMQTCPHGGIPFVVFEQKHPQKFAVRTFAAALLHFDGWRYEDVHRGNIFSRSHQKVVSISARLSIRELLHKERAGNSD